MVFNLVSAHGTILLSFFLFFLILEKVFDLTAELATAIETKTEETKVEMETHPVPAEAKIIKCSM